MRQQWTRANLNAWISEIERELERVGYDLNTLLRPRTHLQVFIDRAPCWIDLDPCKEFWRQTILSCEPPAPVPMPERRACKKGRHHVLLPTVGSCPSWLPAFMHFKPEDILPGDSGYCVVRVSRPPSGYKKTSVLGQENAGYREDGTTVPCYGSRAADVVRLVHQQREERENESEVVALLRRHLTDTGWSPNLAHFATEKICALVGAGQTAQSRCSTPFGDIDGCTRRACQFLVLRLYVLNAFRRH